MKISHDTLPGRAAHCHSQDAQHCVACGIRPISMCSALEERDLGRLAAAMQTQVLEPGQTLFAEGDPADTMFNVTSGTIKLYKLLPDGRRQVTGFLRSGDFLGLAVGDVYAYSAEAVTAAALCRFPRRRLEQLLDEFPKLQQRLFAMAANELVAAQDQMVLLGRKTAREKICTFLRIQARHDERRGMPAGLLVMPMTRIDIADYLGLTIETVSRTITQLKTSGLISLLEGHRVRIEDPARLAALADGG